MVGLFVGLKLRLLRNQLRRGAQQVVGLVVVLGLVLSGAGGVTVVIALGRAEAAVFADLLVLFCAALAFGWALLPVAASGVDTTLDVSRLALLPLRGRRHGPGLFASALVGVGPIATVLVLLGFARHAPGLLAAPLLVAGLLVQTVQLVLLGRVVVAFLGALLRRRRTRELAFSLGALVTAAFGLGVQLLSRAAPGVSRRSLRRWAGWAEWNPFGLGGRGGALALRGELLAAVGWLAAAAVVCLGSALLWWRLIERELTSITGDNGGRRRRRAVAVRHPLAAVAQRELRYLWRHPVARTNTLTGLFLAVLYFVPQRASLDVPDHVVRAAGLVGAVGLSALNMLAVDGRAVAADLLCTTPRQLLSGKALARFVLGMVLVGTAAVALAAWSGGWVYVPVALALGAGLLGPILGVGAFASVAVPVPVPDVASGNPWASAPGQGCVTALAAFVLFVVAAVASSPIVVGAALSLERDSALGLALTALLAPVYGWALWRAGLHLAERQIRGRVPELLAALSPG